MPMKSLRRIRLLTPPSRQDGWQSNLLARKTSVYSANGTAHAQRGVYLAGNSIGCWINWLPAAGAGLAGSGANSPARKTGCGGTIAGELLLLAAELRGAAGNASSGIGGDGSFSTGTSVLSSAKAASLPKDLLEPISDGVNLSIDVAPNGSPGVLVEG